MSLDAIMHGNIRPPQGIFDISVQKKADLGLKIPFADGRVYVYCKAGEGLTVGQQLQAPLVDMDDDDKDRPVQTAGKAIDRELKLTIGEDHASFAANAYEGGWLLLETGTEKGLMRKIKSNDAFTTGTDATVTFKFRDALGVAVAVSGHYASIVACPYYNVMINNSVDGIGSTDNGKPIGAAVVDVTTAYYFWAIVHGMGPAINSNDAAITLGEALTVDADGVIKRAGMGFPLIGHAASYSDSSTDCLMVYYLIE